MASHPTACPPTGFSGGEGAGVATSARPPPTAASTGSLPGHRRRDRQERESERDGERERGETERAIERERERSRRIYGSGREARREGYG